MNTVAFPKKADRLTEQDVHNAIAEMLAAGEKPSALNLLKALGRGSLTTISKFMTSYYNLNDAGTNEVKLPALVDVPREISLSSELLVKKLWADARALANQEIDSQRAALMQTEAEAALKVTEAMEFSELQARRIEELENLVDELNESMKIRGEKIVKLEKANVDLANTCNVERRSREMTERDRTHLEKENQRLEQELNQERKEIDKQWLKIERQAETIKSLEKENKSLELNIGKQQIALDQQTNTLDALKKDLAEQRVESKKAGEYAAKLAGMLEVYQLQEKAKKDLVNKSPLVIVRGLSSGRKQSDSSRYLSVR